MFLEHKPCIECDSSDGLALYYNEEEGGTYSASCFAQCGGKSWQHNELVDTYIGDEYNLQKTDSSNINRVINSGGRVKPAKPPISDEDKLHIESNGKFDDTGYRQLGLPVNEKYGVVSHYDANGNITHRYYPVTCEGNIVGYKGRELPKAFFSKGRNDNNCELFGQSLFPRAGKRLLIVGGECFKGETEILTERGFVPFKDLNTSDKVAQYSEDKSIEFVHPIGYINKHYSGEMTTLSNKAFNIDCTSGHNIALRDKSGKLYKQKASEKIAKTKYFDLAGFCDGVGTGLSLDQIALTLAICADSKIDKRKNCEDYVHFQFMKTRKISRLKELLVRLDIDFNSKTNTWDNGKTYTIFNFAKPSFVKDKQIPKDWVVSASLKEREFIISEMALWDGNLVKDRDSVEFTSKVGDEVNTIVSIAATAGYRTATRRRENALGTWYTCKISKSKNFATSQNVQRNDYFYSGQVYCVTVPSGYIVIRSEGKVVVTGNCDALAAYEMLRLDQARRGKTHVEPIAVVSPTTGESGCVKQIQANYEWIDKFEEVVVMFDNDEAGRDATKKALKVLPVGKTKVVTLSLKDPCDMRKEGKDVEFVRSFYDAKKDCPVGIVGSSGLKDKIMARAKLEKVPLPPFAKKLQKMMAGGIPLGYIINIASASGQGKSTLVNEFIYYWIFHSPYKVGVVSLESDPGEYGELLLSRHVGQKIALFETVNDKVGFLNSAIAQEGMDELFYTPDGEDRFHVVDHQGSVGEDELKAKCEYLVRGLGCRLIIVDPLTLALSGGANEDIDEFMSWQKKFVDQHQCVFVNVTHVRKNSNNQQANSRGGAISEESIKGSGSIFQVAGANILLMRDKENEDPIVRNTTKIVQSKCRWTGITGPAGNWYYENQRHTLYDYDEYFSGVSAEELLSDNESIGDQHNTLESAGATIDDSVVVDGIRFE